MSGPVRAEDVNVKESTLGAEVITGRTPQGLDLSQGREKGEGFCSDRFMHRGEVKAPE